MVYGREIKTMGKIRISYLMNRISYKLAYSVQRRVKKEEDDNRSQVCI